MLLNSTFPVAEIRKAKKEIVTKIKEQEQIPWYAGERELWRLFYPADHPYAHSPDGYADTIEKIDRKGLLKFYKENFSPQDLVLVIGGDIDEALVEEKAQEYFNGFKEEKPVSLPSLEVPKLSGAKEKFIPMEDKSETDIFIGFNGIEGKSKDYLTLKLLIDVLGQFGMMGRLGERIRDKLGLAYHVSMRIERNLGESPIRIVMGVNPKNREKAINAALDEIKKAKKERIKKRELEDVKGYEKGRLWFRIETNDGIASELHTLERFELGLDFWDCFPELIDGITIKKLNDTVERYLAPDAYVLAAAGPPG
jgi:zinc protease